MFVVFCYHRLRFEGPSKRQKTDESSPAAEKKDEQPDVATTKQTADEKKPSTPPDVPESEGSSPPLLPSPEDEIIVPGKGLHFFETKKNQVFTFSMSFYWVTDLTRITYRKVASITREATL